MIRPRLPLITPLTEASIWPAQLFLARESAQFRAGNDTRVQPLQAADATFRAAVETLQDGCGGGFAACLSEMRNTGTVLAIGIAIGAAIGAAMDNVAMGIGIGIAIGIALAYAYKGHLKER
jgi:hypothetical protein